MQDERAEVASKAPELPATLPIPQTFVSRTNVLLVVAIGLSTFFQPFVTTDSPVHGRSQWTPLQLLVSRSDLWRPAPMPFHVHLVIYQIVLTYLLMLITVLALALPSPRRILKIVTLVGAATSASLVGPGACRGFGWLFFGRFTHGPLWDGSLRGLTRWQGFQFELGFYLFLAVMPVLAWQVFRSARQ